WKLLQLAGLVENPSTDYADFSCNRRNLWIADLFNDIAFRVVHRHISKWCDLVLNLLPVTNNHNRRVIGVEVFRRHALNVCCRQRLDLRAKVVDEVLVEIVRVDRVDATRQTKLAGELNREVSSAELLRRV